MRINRKYKDSIFTLLFSNPELLRELYSALEGVDLSPDVYIEVNTLKNVFFQGFKNDVSFLIDDKLVVLVEHQSKINPNMALRFLHYVSDVYERLYDNEALHTSALLEIPEPEFFVLYNGTAPYPDEEILRLSDSFKKRETLGLPAGKKPKLDLEVRVLNINEGRNADIAQHCQKLAEYSAFVAKYREFEKELGSKRAMKATIRYCLAHDILVEFIKVHAKELLGMNIYEWTWEDAIAVAQKEGEQKGLERGREEIALNALADGFPMQTIQKLTGLDLETIKSLQAKPKKME
jgi:hypothetical protein